jgi:hypothetical protein
MASKAMVPTDITDMCWWFSFFKRSKSNGLQAVKAICIVNLLIQLSVRLHNNFLGLSTVELPAALDPAFAASPSLRYGAFRSIRHPFGG